MFTSFNEGDQERNVCLVLSAIGSLPWEIRGLGDAVGVVIHDRRLRCFGG